MGFAKRNKNYSEIVYGFDIETSTYEHITAHYLSSFISVNFGLRYNKDNIINNFSDTVFCRSNEDVNSFLIELNERAQAEDKVYIIYVHNLAYEFDYLIKNIQFVYDNYKNTDSLFIKPRIPLFFRVKNIEFRCSYRLLNKSLEKLGKVLNFPKLSIDYQKQYFPFSELPENEYEYNERDVQLMLLAVLTECSRWKFIESVNDIPLTITGLTRKNNQYINTSTDRKNYAGMCAYQKAYSTEYIHFLENTFQGGYTHANAYFVNRPLRNVASFDIVSSYIDTILHRDYPHFFKKYNGKYHLQFFNHLMKFNTFNYEDVINHYRRPFEWSVMATITLKNVKAISINKNLILPISVSKCSYVSGIKVDNGRIYSAYLVKLNVTEVDYFIIKQFYKFEVVECSELYYTNCHKPLSDYVLNSTREYLNEKSTLKSILSKLEDGKKLCKSDFYNDNKKDYIYPIPEINVILKLPKKEKTELLENNYSVSKGKLNAQYGINVQKLLTPVIEYDKENDVFLNETEEKVSAKVLYRDFVKGLYITAYSRLNLFCYGLYLINHTKTKLIYSDTDSWKCYGDLKNAIKYNKKYNEHIEKIVQNSVDYNIGYFDYELSYDYFATLGCKKYIFSDGRDIFVTIAGVSKKKTSENFSKLFHSLHYDFNEFCKIAFNPCTILSHTITGKLITKYNSGEYAVSVIDENGDSGIISGYNMVELESSDYVLMDYDKPVINEYIQYFSDLQNNQAEIFPTLIYKDESGDVTYKYITEWDNTLKILRGDDVNFMNINL